MSNALFNCIQRHPFNGYNDRPDRSINLTPESKKRHIAVQDKETPRLLCNSDSTPEYIHVFKGNEWTEDHLDFVSYADVYKRERKYGRLTQRIDSRLLTGPNNIPIETLNEIANRTVQQAEQCDMMKSVSCATRSEHYEPVFERIPNSSSHTEKIKVKSKNIALDIGPDFDNTYVSSYEYDPLSGELNIDYVIETYKARDDKEEKRILYRQKVRMNLVIKVKSRGGLINGVDPKEWTAIETLREMVTEREFRRYLKYGFLNVESASGKVYQVFRDRNHTKVWAKGKLVEEVCVRLSASTRCPPTDNVIAFKQMIETDEGSFRKCGNVYNMRQRAA